MFSINEKIGSPLLFIVILAGLIFCFLIFNYRSIFKWFKRTSWIDRFTLGIFLLLTISGIILILYSVLCDLDSKVTLEYILLTLTNINIATIWEKYGILLEIKDNISANNKSLFRTRNTVERETPIDIMWSDAKSVIVATMGASAFFVGRLKENLDQAIKSGTKFTIITIKPDSSAWYEHTTYKMVNNTPGNVKACHSVPETITIHYKGRIAYYQTEINIPYAIMCVEKLKQEESFVKIDLYAIDISDGERPCIVIPYGEPYYDFFKDQIAKIVKHSEKVG